MDNNVSWMFFNCDSYTTWGSIVIDTKDMLKVRNEILFGNPVNATDYMTYGAIIDLEEVR